MLCSVVAVYWCFRGICCLHHQCRMTCITDGGSRLLWKVGTHTRLHAITLNNILFLILKSSHVIETGDWKWLLESHSKITTILAMHSTVQLWLYCQEFAPTLFGVCIRAGVWEWKEDLCLCVCVLYIYSFKKSNPFLSFSLPVLEYKCHKWEQSTVLQHILKFSSSFYIAILCVYIRAPLNFWTSLLRFTKLVINVMPGGTNHMWYLILGCLNDVWQWTLEEYGNFCWSNFIKCKTAWI